MEPHVPSLKRILESGRYDTVLAYYNLLNWTAQEPPPPGVNLFDNGQIIPLAKSLDMGVIGIRSHAGWCTDRAGRPASGPWEPAGPGPGQSRVLEFLLEGPISTLSQAAMIFCLMNQDIHTTVPGVKNTAEAVTVQS